MKREFTATAFVIHENKLLFVFHKKLQRWLPPGGHIDEGETPDDAAVREVKEETGLDIELIGSKQDKMNDIVYPLFIPELVQLEDIEHDGYLHQHIDFIYLAVPKTHEILGNDENEDIRWFTIEEMKEHGVANDILYQAKLALEKARKV